jgi:hypothetical protein
MVKPPREAGLLPWSEIAVDMISPWTLEVGNRTKKFSTLTIIDLVTHLVEICVNNKTTVAVTAHFDNAWLACYPTRLELLHCNNIQSCCTTTKNYKQMHLLCA